MSCSSTGSNCSPCVFSSAYSARAVSNSAEYFCSCSSSSFKLASISATFFLTLETSLPSVQSILSRRIAFSDCSSSSNSVSSAILAVNSFFLGIFQNGNSFFSARRSVRSLLVSLIWSTTSEYRFRLIFQASTDFPMTDLPVRMWLS